VWVGGTVLVVAVTAGLVMAFPSPKPSPDAKPSTQKAPPPKRPPKQTSFAPKKQQVLTTAMEFVESAVTRHNVAASWDLVTPAMKQGHTRADWASGRDLPVIKYPAIFATWHLAYSYSDEVDLQVALFARKHQVRPQVFDITLHPVRQGRRTQWLVDSFLPTPAEGGGIGNGPNRRGVFVSEGPNSPQVGKIWLLIPLSIFALLPAVLIALGVRRWRAAKLYRAYARGE
jgi:hypothetical protein